MTTTDVVTRLRGVENVQDARSRLLGR